MIRYSKTYEHYNNYEEITQTLNKYAQPIYKLFQIKKLPSYSR
jgi:hypothetical protein